MNAIARTLLTAAALAVGTGFLAPADSSAQQSTLKPNDRITLKISGVPPNDQALVSGIYTISESGTLNLPHLNDYQVQATGVSRSDLEKRIEAAYRQAEIYTRPTISINIDEQAATARVVTVYGEVQRSGQVAYRDGMTLIEAIAAAGGHSEFASMKNIRLIRNGRTTSHDLSQVSSNPQVDRTLQPDDRIIVPERGLFGR